ncbi:uncharacterized protein B0J16DRAFT_368216 [Fusarium flagelliforme]|uniref:uncharacterized protein n=1 Tax=Fusarium flagelliforme TaxID=2675880 RepID=UPI001E8DE740|nr:uncharacterized protein B0J16DRAFT_368216 [Fusarium flagelliforme]KAH7191912.1 hypothetical protein B0J16DRAFT_368216 [Fusarium flagelliforme]
MLLQDIDQAKRAGLKKTAFDERNSGTGEHYSLNHKAKELVAKSREAYHTASTLAESVEAIMETRQTIESTDLARYKADVDALMAWAIEEKPAFVRMLKTLGDELPPKMAAALERLHLDAPDSQPLHEAEQKSLEADVRAGKEEVASVRKLAEAEAQKNKLLQEKLSKANIIADDLDKKLFVREAGFARQDEELVQVRETSRKKEESFMEFIYELAQRDVQLEIDGLPNLGNR